MTNSVAGSRSRAAAVLGLAAALALGCGRPIEPPDAGAPVVYDFAARGAHAALMGAWATLDMGSAAAEPYLLNGWGEVVDDRAGGQARWAADKRADLLLLCTEPGAQTLEIACRPYSRSWRRQSVRVSINGIAIERFKLPREPTICKVAIPAEALMLGENRLRFDFAYSSRRKGRSVRFGTLRFSGAAPGAATAPRGGAGPDWTQAADTVASWRVRIPRGAVLRVQPAWDTPGTQCRVTWRADGREEPLAVFDAAPQTPRELPLAAQAGVWGHLSFANFGGGPVRWTARLHGNIDGRDANVYLITIDTVRADAVGHLAPGLDTTPALDRLAARGVAFEAAYVQSNESVPSHACILTGRYPQSHGITRNGRELNRQQRPLADLLGRQGFDTACYVNFGVLSWGTMTGHDFDKRRAILGTPPRLDLSATEENVFAGGLNWVRAVAERRHFLWLHSQFMHLEGMPEAYTRRYWPSVCPPGEEDRFDAVHRKMDALGFRHVSLAYSAGKLALSEAELAYWQAAYRGALRYSDDHLAAFLHALGDEGLDPYAALIVTSDHGMSLGEGHHLTHVGPPHAHLMRVPLVMVLPGGGLAPGRRVTEPVESVDIAPTLMAYLGRRVPRRMQGVDLIAALRADAPYRREAVHAVVGRKGGRSYYGIRNAEWVYWTNFDDREFLGRAGSGDDFNSLHQDEPATLDAMRQALLHWIRITPDVTGGREGELSEEVRRLLEKAGYLESRE